MSEIISLKTIVDILTNINEYIVYIEMVLCGVVYFLWGMFYCPIGICKMLLKWRQHNKKEKTN
ncbi:hypothetical protein [Megamonas hypermegale]|uniref:hypothetical protein n=1 Tax=Megamonas hypermegale TaxID=158847 RepID=UPI0026F0BBCB|nr:hypothetical protein [Megamonas hypermegale]